VSVPRLRRTSLTARVAAAVVGLVALVSLLISVLTTTALGAFLTDQLDDRLAGAHERSVRALERDPIFDLPPLGSQPGAPFDGPSGGPPRGQEVGTVTVNVTDGEAEGTVIGTDSSLEPVGDEDLEALAELTPADHARTIDLPDLGEVRVRVSMAGDVTVVTGLPTDSVQETVSSLVTWEVLFSVIGVLAAGGLAVVVVRRQLRPLREVAVTAHRVSALDLSSGDIGVTARVPARLVESGTEVGEVALALNTMLGHVESALAERHRSEQQVRQFVADASHELRTPLATISGYAELSLREQEEAALAHAMGKVQVEAQRMTSLVEDLLLLARLDAGRPLERAEVDLTRLVMEAVADSRVTGPEHRWVLRLPDEPVTVPGDELRLHQVLSNLLANARRHTPAGTTVTTSIAPSVGDVSHAVQVTVTDDGPGITPELLDGVFTRFTRGDTARTRESSGAGLGLSLARAIALAHGGDLAVESAPGRTRFIFTLPR
jgi:two-component system, OmpR family, sensor kinase